MSIIPCVKYLQFSVAATFVEGNARNISYLNLRGNILMCFIQESPLYRTIVKTVVRLINQRKTVRIHADNGHTQIGAHQVVTYAHHVS